MAPPVSRRPNKPINAAMSVRPGRSRLLVRSLRSPQRGDGGDRWAEVPAAAVRPGRLQPGDPLRPTLVCRLRGDPQGGTDRCPGVPSLAPHCPSGRQYRQPTKTVAVATSDADRLGLQLLGEFDERTSGDYLLELTRKSAPRARQLPESFPQREAGLGGGSARNPDIRHSLMLDPMRQCKQGAPVRFCRSEAWQPCRWP